MVIFVIAREHLRCTNTKRAAAPGGKLGCWV